MFLEVVRRVIVIVQQFAAQLGTARLELENAKVFWHSMRETGPMGWRLSKGVNKHAATAGSRPARCPNR